MVGTRARDCLGWGRSDGLGEIALERVHDLQRVLEHPLRQVDALVERERHREPHAVLDLPPVGRGARERRAVEGAALPEPCEQRGPDLGAATLVERRVPFEGDEKAASA